MAENTENSIRIWHFDVHRQWGKETLYFFKIGFGEIYNKRLVAEELDKFFCNEGLRSYVRHEVYGVTDVLLQVWISDEWHTKTTEHFTSRLIVHFATCGLSAKLSVADRITDILYHWKWRTSDKSLFMSRPALTGEPHIGLVEKIDSRDSSSTAVKPAEKAHLIRNYTPPSEGIPFFIFIPRRQSDDFHTGQKEVIEPLTRELSRKQLLRELVVYQGEGSHSYLMTGRIDSDCYQKLSNDIVDKVNFVGIASGVKTQTYLGTGYGRAEYYYAEQLVLPKKTPRIDFSPIESVDYCEVEEDLHREVKGALRADLNAYFKEDKPLKMTKDMPQKGVLKAIAGLLNAFGGEVIIGLLEKREFPNCAKLEKGYPSSRSHYVVGLEVEGDFKNWDQYRRRLLQQIRSRITPNKKADSWLTIERVATCNKTLAVVRVQIQPPHSYMPFKLNGKQYRRHPGETLEQDSNEIAEWPSTRANIIAQNFAESWPISM